MKGKKTKAKKVVAADGRTAAGRLHKKRSDAAKRAWLTIRANRAKAKAAA